jgi:hypothetical protein
VLLGAASGVAFGVSSVLTQTLGVRLTDDGLLAVFSPTAALVAALAVGGLLLAQSAYRGSGLGTPLATLTLVNPVVAVLIGVALLGERFTGGPTGVLLVVLCGGVAASGVALLSTGKGATVGEGSAVLDEESAAVRVGA